MAGAVAELRAEAEASHQAAEIALERLRRQAADSEGRHAAAPAWALAGSAKCRLQGSC